MNKFRFIKQSYNLEDIRVTKYQRLKNLVVLVTAAAYFAATFLGQKMKLRILCEKLLIISQRFFGIPPFRFYALADGIRNVLVQTSCVVVAVTTQAAFAQSTASDISALRKEVEAMKAIQAEMQKNIRTIKDILMGKKPPLEDVVLSTTGAASMGSPDAKVTLVEFTDYQCPFCGRYASETYKKIIGSYVKTSKVRYIVRNFPLEEIHANAGKEAEAAKCAGEQGKFREMHERLLGNQAQLGAKELPAHAAKLGLDEGKFQECMSSGRAAAKVQADEADGRRLNVSGTPSFFFGYPDEKDPAKVNAVKLLSGAHPLSAFTEILDGLLNPPREQVPAR